MVAEAVNVYRGEFADIVIPKSVVEWFESIPRGKNGKKTKKSVRLGRQIMNNALRQVDVDLAWSIANGR